MDPNLKVSLSTITNPLNRLAKHATTATEKTYIFQVVDAVGTAIGEQHPNFIVGEFLKACGVSPEWATQAA